MILLMGHVGEHPEELGYIVAILGTVSYLIKHFFGKRTYEKKLRVLETKMEDDPSISGMGGSNNPGRSTVDLLDVVYSDVKDIKKTLTRHEGELGKIKGKLGIN